MTQYPMVDQVNRLAGNLLAAGGELYLPGVGSLCVRFHGAKRLSARLVEPPSREVVFTSQQRGVSLVDEIARVLRASAPAEGPQAGGEQVAAQAQDIYDRWLMRTRQDDVLTIEGVGVLKFKHFTPDEAFDRRINPQGHTPVRIHRPRRFDGVMWMGIAAIVFVVAFTAYWWLDNRHDAAAEPVTLVAAAPVATEGLSTADAPADADVAANDAGEAVAGAAADGSAADAAGGSAHATPSASTGREAAAASDRPAPSANVAAEPARLVSGRRYVVLGVYSTPENAARAARLALETDGSFRCGVYRFGAKFMVSPFESEDAEACTLFIRAHAETFPGMWTYTAR
ncbi:hypothetical protein [uncultured Alistipes sp.]|uniref:hypothetical protein n=1 Tax=uncultured Alistipes sp. TaxID=538949 RepID=UPI002622AAF8|nr:hypothetical protein [uncultured Alistipes sp.]